MGTHASIVADEMMTRSSGRFFMILPCQMGLPMGNLLLHHPEQQVGVCAPFMSLVNLDRSALSRLRWSCTHHDDAVFTE